MRLTQGSFSFLPDLTDDEIEMQISYALDHQWPVSVEYTDDPHPRNIYWQMWGLPMFDLTDPAGVMREITACRQTFPRHYIRVQAYDASLGRRGSRRSRRAPSRSAGGRRLRCGPAGSLARRRVG